jgi:hypothetical protein
VTIPAPQERARGCASDLDLDELMSGDLAGQPKEARLRSHVETCAACRDRLAAFAAVLPPDPARILPRVAAAAARADRPARRRFAVVTASLAFAAAAAIALLVRPGGDTERTKGGAALTLLVKRAAGAAGTTDAIAGEGTLHPGDEMRFSFASARPGYVVVLGIDAAPSVTIYAPAAPGSRAIRIEGTGYTVLPGSIVADATAGIERIVALLCAKEPDPETLRARAAAALTAADGKPDRVSALGTDCVESSVLVRKEAAPR